jgi:mRNA interferase RelE/StbE
LPELRITRRAKRDLEALPAGIREAVFETIALIALEPEAMGNRLVGRLAGIWSARAGSYRVPYTIERSGVVVRAVRHRAVAYRRR